MTEKSCTSISISAKCAPNEVTVQTLRDFTSAVAQHGGGSSAKVTISAFANEVRFTATVPYSAPTTSTVQEDLDNVLNNT